MVKHMKKLVFLLCLVLISGCVHVQQPEKQPEIDEPVFVDKSDENDVPVVEIFEKDMISNERTDFNTVWTLKGDGIGYSREIDKDLHEISILSWEDVSKPLTMSCYGIPLVTGAEIQVSMTVSSDVSTRMEITFSDYEDVLGSKSFSIQQEPTVIEWKFVMNQISFWDGKLSMNFYSNHQNGTINVSDIQVTSKDIKTSVKINQLGYLPESEKTAVFAYNSGDIFSVVDTQTNSIVYTGRITGRVENSAANEVNYIGDFSELKTPGKYKIISQVMAESYEFEIVDEAYSQLLKDSLLALSSQRCGQSLSSEVFFELAHDACHQELALSVVNEEKIDVSGGWHDAGDYGRYVTPGVKAVSDLLMASILYEDSFSDEMGLMESGNGVIDILDEARVELEWLMKMQRDTGSFYNSVISKNFAPLISPEEDQQQLYIMKQENSATAAATAALALASYVYEDVDPDFSVRCLQSAKKGYLYAKSYQGSEDIFNPEGYNGGDYPNVSDLDELFYASMSMYLATSDASYLEDAQTLMPLLSDEICDFTYDCFSGYGTVLYLLFGSDDTQFYQDVKEIFLNKVQSVIDDSNSDGYFVSSVYSYSWGASMYLCSDALMLLCAYELTEDKDILQSIQNHLDYLLGKNALNMSFVSGYGVNYPHHLHNRLTIGKQAYLKGALVSGVDRNRGSEVLASSVSKETAPAKCYLDHVQSYTNNEVAIYFNSGLIFLLAGMESIY